MNYQCKATLLITGMLFSCDEPIMQVVYHSYAGVSINFFYTGSFFILTGEVARDYSFRFPT